MLVSTFFVVFLSIAEIAVYREVHVKIYYNLLLHLKHVDELFHSVSITLLVAIFSIVTLFLLASYHLINRLFPNYSAHLPNKKRILLLTLSFVATCSFTVIGCRGGLQPIPINEGEVYFTNNQCTNDATVNPLWNIIHSYIETIKVLEGNTYNTMPDEEAEKIVRQLFHFEKDTTVSLFKINRPNICFIILESWSADVSEALGGYKGLTPNFDNLAKEGYLFADVKPTGHLSDQGIPGILSGYPALPIGSAINQPGKYPKLPCINNELQKAGYKSSFFFGGQLIYGNIKSYIYYNKFDKVMEQADFPASIPAGRLGIHDSIMLSIWKDSLAHMQTPFFSCLFTLSSHSPFDAPGKPVINWGTMEDPYLNSIVYSDRQLGNFFQVAKQESWYNNTIFVLVADHSHNVPKNYPISSAEYYHIPLLICGGALKDEFRGIRDEQKASQLDIAATLLKQLNISASRYRWSKNLMNPYCKRFAFYTFNEGFGYCTHDGSIVWDKKKSAPLNTDKTDSLTLQGAAMLQTLMNDFLSK